jgi:uncharacterized integral membrane protein
MRLRYLLALPDALTMVFVLRMDSVFVLMDGVVLLAQLLLALKHVHNTETVSMGFATAGQDG